LTLAATFQMLLYRCTSEEDIAVAVSIPNRSHKAVENVVGPFANYLTLRMLFTGEIGFLDVLQQLRNTATTSLANQDVPFELVTKDLQPNLIQVMFALDDKTRDLAQPSDGAFSDLSLVGSETNFELCMLLQQGDTQLSGQIAYNPDLFDHATIERFVKDYQTLVENILNAPEHSVKQL
jgi:non-ribosomal peptide synthetase component F